MSESDKISEEEYQRSWIEAEIEETLDDLFEAEFNQPILTEELRKIYKDKRPDMLDRHTYYSNLLRLQSELVKLQDWVEHTKSKVLIICEGRDSAGKGGVIKRITQRMNPRVARVVALPAPTEREQSQWYFQPLVVKDLNLQIGQGEFLTMLGPSGSGKTTCLMMLAGFETATHGEILLQGRPMSGLQSRAKTASPEKFSWIVRFHDIAQMRALSP